MLYIVCSSKVWFQNRRAKWRKKEKQPESNTAANGEDSSMSSNVQLLQSSHIEANTDDGYVTVNDAQEAPNPISFTNATGIHNYQPANHEYAIPTSANGLPPGFYFVPFSNPQTVPWQTSIECKANSAKGSFASYDYNFNQHQPLGTAGYPLYVIQDPITGLSQIFLHFSAYNFQYSSSGFFPSMSRESESNFDSESDNDTLFSSEFMEDSSSSNSSCSEEGRSESSSFGSIISQRLSDYKSESEKTEEEDKIPLARSANEDDYQSKENDYEYWPTFESLPVCNSDALPLINSSKENSGSINEGGECATCSGQGVCSDEDNSSKDSGISVRQHHFEDSIRREEKILVKAHCEQVEYSDGDAKDSLEHYVDSLVSMEEGICDKGNVPSQPSLKSAQEGLTKNCIDSSGNCTVGSVADEHMKLFSSSLELTPSKLTPTHKRNSINEQVDCSRVKEESSNDDFDVFLDCHDRKVLEERLLRSHSELQQLNFEDEQRMPHKPIVQKRKDDTRKSERVEVKETDNVMTCIPLENANSSILLDPPNKRRRLSSLTLESCTNNAGIQDVGFPDCSDSIDCLINIKQEREDIENDVVLDGNLDLHSIREAYSKMTGYVLA